MRRTLILSVTLFGYLCGFSQSDTLIYTFTETKVIEDKLTIKRLSLADIVTKKKSIPKEVRSFRSLESLSLRPRPTRFARPIGGGPCIIGYAKTKTKTLPSWIGELKSLEELDLIGINNIDYPLEISKIVGLDRLTELSIDPDHFDDKLLKVLVRFTALRSLKIRATPTDQQLDILKSELPNCEIVTGLYADY